MTRREAREQAFCILFEHAVAGEEVSRILENASEARDLVPDPFAEEICFGVEERLSEIDETISRQLRGWSLRRLSKVTLSLLRLAVYEILYMDSIPAGVSVNEAVELAKTYGTQDDASYLNGVLASIVKEQEGT